MQVPLVGEHTQAFKTPPITHSLLTLASATRLPHVTASDGQICHLCFKPCLLSWLAPSASPSSRMRPTGANNSFPQPSLTSGHFPAIRPPPSRMGPRESPPATDRLTARIQLTKWGSEPGTQCFPLGHLGHRARPAAHPFVGVVVQSILRVR